MAGFTRRLPSPLPCRPRAASPPRPRCAHRSRRRPAWSPVRCCPSRRRCGRLSRGRRSQRDGPGAPPRPAPARPQPGPLRPPRPGPRGSPPPLSPGLVPFCARERMLTLSTRGNPCPSLGLGHGASLSQRKPGSTLAVSAHRIPPYPLVTTEKREKEKTQNQNQKKKKKTVERPCNTS